MLFALAHAPEDPNHSFELMFQRLAKLEVPIVLENVAGQSDDFFVDFYLQAKDYLGEHLAGFALDISHRFVTNAETWLDIPEVLKRDIAYVHISDCTKTEDLHLPLGFGELPYNEFFAFLKGIGYDGVINQELKPNGDQAEAIMSSSQLCIKPFSKTKYLRMKFREAIMRAILKLRRKEFTEVIDRTADEIGYDFV